MFIQGHSGQKKVPPGCPQGAPQDASQQNSTKAFAYARTVIWAYANGYLGIRKQLFGRTQTVITLRLTPCNSVPLPTLVPLHTSKRAFWGAVRTNGGAWGTNASGGNVGHEVATANETEDGNAVVLVQDTQRAQHLSQRGAAGGHVVDDQHILLAYRLA